MSAGSFTQNLHVLEKGPNARFLVSKLGRFGQPDILVPNQAFPQALNRFSYVYNNPGRFVDETGHDAGCSIYLDNQCAVYTTNSGTKTTRDISTTPTQQEIQIWIDEIFGEDAYIETPEEGFENAEENIEEAFWDSSIPTTITIDLEFSGQYGFGAEGGGGAGKGLVCNWVEGRCAIYRTTFGYAYIGFPNGLSFSGTLAVSLYDNTSSIFSIAGPGAFEGFTIGADTLGDVSVSGGSTESQTSLVGGSTFIDLITNRPVEGGYASASIGSDVVTTVVQGGYVNGESYTTIEDVVFDPGWWPFRWLIPEN